MPPHPRNRPALEVARPGDTTAGRDHGWHRDTSETGWEMIFGDRHWHPVDARAWWTDDRGRRVVQIYWHAELDTFGESYLFDAEKAREG
jgi:hypothetical protein